MKREMKRSHGSVLVSLALAAPLGLLWAGASMADESAVVATAEVPVKGRIGFVGRNIFGRADGEFHVWRVLSHSVDLANPVASHAVVEVELASVDTQSEGRDDDLRTADFFDVEKFPVATVRGHSARPLEPSESGHQRYAVQFDVDLHGVQKSIEGEVEIVETQPVVVEGGFLIRRTDFAVGSKPSRWNPMSIDDEVPVRFRIALE
jgi:polyisoprenoid-binding protein YceI